MWRFPLVETCCDSTRQLLKLLISLVTWSVANITAEVKDFRLISLDTNRFSLWSGELSVELVGDLLWGWYLRVVKCDNLVLSFGHRFTIYCLDSSSQVCRFRLMIQRLHKLSPLLSFMFDRYSGDLIVYLLEGGQGRVSGADLSQYLCWNLLCVESVSSRGYVVSCCFKNDGTQDLFSFLAVGRKLYFAQIVFNLSTVSAAVCLFHVDTGTMLWRVDSDCYLQTKEDW